MGIEVNDYNLVFPTAASGRGAFFNVNGQAIVAAATGQPKVDGGAMAGTFGQNPGSALVDGVSTYRESPDSYGSVAYSSGNVQWGVYPALNVSTQLGVVTAGQYVMPFMTKVLADVNKGTDLLAGGATLTEHLTSIHQVTTVWTRQLAQALRQGYWNPFTGSFSTVPAVVNDFGTFTTNGTDDAANPSQSIPGELVYNDGKPNPVQDDYAAREIW